MTEPRIDAAVTEGKLLEAAAGNLREWLTSPAMPGWARESMEELIAGEHWEELNNRFYQTIAFGTGGMRERTIGTVVTRAEGPAGNPARAAVGSNNLNDFNVVMATIGLFRHSRAHLDAEGRDYEIPRLVIAHDVRFFSRHFCELAASTWVKLGGQACIFDGPRSTPQLSFSVRFLGAVAGIVITASHNPPHDNGYKVYFEDGAQVVSPHAEGIIAEFGKVDLAETGSFLEKDLARVVTLPPSADAAYIRLLEEGIVDRARLGRVSPRVVFTPIHGTGGVISAPLLKAVGVDVRVVAEQAEMDPRFPTVKSPNPENAEALEMGLALAEAEGADAVLATDPDADRMGAAVRGPDGRLTLITGNMIGSLFAEFRITQLKEAGLLPPGGSERAALIKTFVTTPLQDAIGKAHGLKVVNTLTGFKWIGAKLRQYEHVLRDALRSESGLALDYDGTSAAARARLLLEHSTFYVVGGEESYGYLHSDRVRDKDANAAVLLFCEMLAALKEEGRTVPEYLDSIYLKYGFFLEQLGNVYYEGAAGAGKIRRILASYRENPPRELDGVGVAEVTDFGRDEIVDPDGDRIPPQDFYFLKLENGYSYAVRGSGTEPKIKFYVFGRDDVSSADELPAVKEKTRKALTRLREAIEADAAVRAGG